MISIFLAGLLVAVWFFYRGQARLANFRPEGRIGFESRGRIAMSTMRGYRPANVFVTDDSVVVADIYSFLANYRARPPMIRTFPLALMRNLQVLDDVRRTPISVAFNVGFDFVSSTHGPVSVRLWVEKPAKLVSSVLPRALRSEG